MEWIVTECMVAAGCQLEVSAALIVSGELNRRVICTGGFHKDGISAEEIREVQESVGRLTECVIRRLQV